MKKHMGLMLLFLGVVVLTGCGKNEAEVIRFGVLGPFSGEGATYGEAMRRGIDIAVDELRSENIVSDRKIEVISYDTKLSASEAISGFKMLENRGVQVVFGAAASSVSLALAPIANQSEIPLISSISTADDLTEAGPFFFRNVPRNSNQAMQAAAFLRETLSIERAAVIFENNDYGLNMRDVFITTFEESGGTILMSDSYNSGAVDFKSLLAKAKSLNPQALFLPGTYNEIGFLLKQAKEMDITSVFMSGDGAYSPVLLETAGSAAEGFLCTMMGLQNTASENYVNLQRRYYDKYNTDLDVYSVYSYDAVMIVAKAIQALDGEEVTAAGLGRTLSGVRHHGVAGYYQFDGNNDVNVPFEIYHVIEGAFRSYTP